MRLLLALALIAIACPASADDGSQIWIANSTDCGLWGKGRDTHTAPIPESYLVGSLNGLAFGTGVDFWHAKGIEISVDAAYLWMDKYCRDHPLEMMMTGAIQLFSERTGWKAENR